MDFLKAEIERKRKANAQLKTSVKRRKYMSKKEIEAEKLKEEIERLEAENKQKTIQKKENEEKEKKENEEKEKGEERTECKFPAEEVKLKLRARNEVVTFFGESDLEREIRYLELPELTEEEYRKGLRNEFQSMLREEDEATESAADQKSRLDDKKKQKKISEDANYDPNVLRESSDCVETSDVITSIIRRLLNEWEEQLDNRSTEVKRSAQGRRSKAIYKQTSTDLSPLFKKLRKNALSADILEYLRKICDFMKDREYVKANDAYLEMAIGNSPWPIGVTMVGIHERSAREKIFSNQIAHVLNDETQRKYIQAIKRLITFAQQRYPTVPSKMVG